MSERAYLIAKAARTSDEISNDLKRHKRRVNQATAVGVGGGLGMSLTPDVRRVTTRGGHQVAYHPGMLEGDVRVGPTNAKVLTRRMSLKDTPAGPVLRRGRPQLTTTESKHGFALLQGKAISDRTGKTTKLIGIRTRAGKHVLGRPGSFGLRYGSQTALAAGIGGAGYHVYQHNKKLGELATAKRSERARLASSRREAGV